MDTDQIWSETGLNFSIYNRPNYHSQNCPTSQTPIFGGKLEIRTMAVRRYQAGSRACQNSNPTNTRSHCYRAPYFWSQKWDHIPNFIGRFCTCGGSNKVLKIWAKFTCPIWCEKRVKIWGPKFQRTQKRELGPKKNQWVEGNISRLKFPQKNFYMAPKSK